MNAPGRKSRKSPNRCSVPPVIERLVMENPFPVEWSQWDGPEVLTPQETAHELTVGTRDVFRLIEEEGLPVVRVGQDKLRIRREDLRTWLASRVCTLKPGETLNLPTK